MGLRWRFLLPIATGFEDSLLIPTKVACLECGVFPPSAYLKGRTFYLDGMLERFKDGNTGGFSHQRGLAQPSFDVPPSHSGGVFGTVDANGQQSQPCHLPRIGKELLSDLPLPNTRIIRTVWGFFFLRNKPWEGF